VGRRKKDTDEYPEGAQVVDRLLAAYGVATLALLSERLGEKFSTVKNWRYRGAVPNKALLRTAKDTERSLDWLLTGEEAVSLAPKSRNYESLANRRIDERRADGGGAAGNHLVRTDATRTDGLTPYAGSLAHVRAAENAFMAPTEIGIERPLVLPVRYELQRTSREYQVIPNIEEPAKAGSAPSLKGVQRSVAANVAGVLAMDRAWMAEQLGRDDGGFATVTVSGHSMTPTLHDGDTIVIDTLVTNVEIDGIYVLRRGTTLVVKRITLKMDESAVISGDNDAHGPGEILQPATVRELRVVGRMVWPRFR
jgi:hypothetical protein